MMAQPLRGLFYSTKVAGYFILNYDKFCIAGQKLLPAQFLLFSSASVIVDYQKGGMMTSVFLDKAKANLVAAQHCFNWSLYEASANRAYGAAFQAAIAALQAHEIRSDKNEHKWVQASFSRELIHRKKIYPGKLRRYLSDMLTIRNDADYSEIRLSKGVAHQQLNRAKEFVEAIQQEIER